MQFELNKGIQTAKGNQRDQIQRQIEKTDKAIDEIVYKLYGITGEEKDRLRLMFRLRRLPCSSGQHDLCP